MTNINEKRMSILLDTIRHYNSSNRSVTPSGNSWWDKKCSYFPAHPNTQGCAVGRLLPSDISASMDQNKIVDTEINWSKLPDVIQELGAQFLTDLQSLHDCCDFWNENGLTEAGERHAAYIKIGIENGSYDK